MPTCPRPETARTFARRARRAALSLAPLLALALGCDGGDSGGTGAAGLPSLRDVDNAPAPIQTAARAVVLIETAGFSGTGSFISSSGLLMTNNHVLGVDVCPREGCALRLSFLHQRGETPRGATAVFGVPVAVDVGLDVAFVQIYDSSFDRQPLQTPDFLAWSDDAPAALRGTHVTVVGHPEGHLKKWASGTVVDTSGDWFTSSAYILPGDSGSPVLDDGGKIVGIIHRGPTSQDLFTRDGANEYSIGTAAAPLQAARGAALPAVMISTAAEATAAQVVADNLVYLNAGAASVTVQGAPVSVLSLLGQACDVALARTDFTSPDDLSGALRPCHDAILWIECRADAAPPPYGVVCPAGDDAAAWASRYQADNRQWVAMNGSTDLYPVSFGVQALAPSRAEGQVQGAAGLLQALTSAQAILDFGAMNYLAAFDIDSYAGANSFDWLRRYADQPDYQLFATSIASAYLWWQSYGAASAGDVQAVLASLAGDPHVDVGAQLYIDEVLYARGH